MNYFSLLVLKNSFWLFTHKTRCSLLFHYSGTYNTHYFKSLRHYLTKDVLPAESNYRNILSIGGQNSNARKFSRPTLDELHDESGEVKQQLLKAANIEKVIFIYFSSPLYGVKLP